MNKWIPTLLGLVCSSTVFANVLTNVFPSSGPFSGIYVGANIGLIQNDIDHQRSEQISFTDFNFVFNTNSLHKMDSSLLGGLTLGFAAFMDRGFLVGIEGRANYQDLDVNQSDLITEDTSGLYLSSSTGIKLREDYAILAKLGFVANCDVLVYGLIGIDWGKMDASSNISFNSNNGGPFVGQIQGSRSHYESGLALGLGMEYLFMPCASLGLEYDYVDYSNIDFPSPITGNVTSSGTLAGFLQDTNSIEMKTNKVLIKVNYYFA